MSNIHRYIDASHQTHDYCRGHIGALLTSGRGASVSLSTKHKINMKSSTESKIVGLYDKSSDILWMCNFLEAQGDTISNNFAYQDNMNTLSLAKNGYVSSSKRSKYINVKYFFVKHYYHLGEITLTYCPNNLMWADILTKPLQGSTFCTMRAFLMNCPVDYSEDPAFISPPTPLSIPMKPRLPRIAASPQECVETKSPSTKVLSSSELIVCVPSKLTPKHVSWCDNILPRRPSANTHFAYSNPYRILATAE